MTDPRTGNGLYVTVGARLEQVPTEEDGSGIWDVLANRVDQSVYRPKLRDDIEIKTFRLRWGNDYSIIANPTEFLHFQISPEDAELLPLMDGSRTVKELMVERLQGSGDLEIEDVADLVKTLRESNFLTDRFVNVPDVVRRAGDKASAARRKGREFAKTLSVEFEGVNGLVVWFYQNLLRFFFRPTVAIPVGLIAVLGVVAFAAVYFGGDFELGGGSPLVQTLVLLVLDYVLTFIHELGHAVVLVHYGRRVKSAGFMIYFGSPAFFVESADGAMLERGQRIVQSFAGPYAEMVVSGLASMFVWAFPDAAISPFLFTWAVLNYFVILLNLIPLLELDGYWILSDLIQVPDLRPRSLQFIRYGLWRKLRGKERITKQEVGLALYGFIGVAFTILSFYTAYFFWQTVFGGLVADLWNGGLLGRLLLLALGLFLVGPILRGLIALVRSLLRKLRAVSDRIRFKLQTQWRVEAAELIDGSPMLDDLPEDVLSDLAGRVSLRAFPAGKSVFRQGDRPDAFYIVRRGTLNILEEDPQTGKERVLRTLARGDTFGELGVIDGTPRSATVRAVEDAELFEVDESTFDRLLADMVHLPEFAPTLQQAAEVRALRPFEGLGAGDVSLLLEHGEWMNVAPGEVVVQQGGEGDAFYVIGSGQLDVRRGDELVATLGPGAYFGEIALLTDVPRTASVKARTPARVYRIDREGFDAVVAAAFRRGTLTAASVVERTSQH